ncbi:hypothetical protein D9M69_655240 [compost metagenome]
MLLEDIEVAGGDHAGDFDAQRRQSAGSAANGFHRDLRSHVGGQILLELGPAGDQLFATTFDRAVLHLHQVVFGSVGADEDRTLSSGHQQLLFQLPVVMRLQIARADLADQALVPELVLE